ncbi:MAG: hypothetical protein LBH76_01575, partial [Propionibacteriaceae bacterium]|nr:hypothetical protein [Propionibacteriaceae bacterium]
LDKAQVQAVFADLKVRPERPPWTGSPERQPSSIPPVPAPAEPEGVNIDDLVKVPLPPTSAEPPTSIDPPGDWAPPARPRF